MGDYLNKCGSCMNYEYLVINEKLTKRGRCILKNRANYHQASQNACKEYVEMEPGRCRMKN